MTIGINTSPLAGKEGKQLTARLVKGRLDKELVGNVSIQVKPTERPDTWEVQGRGELRSEEHTSELQSLMRISYAVFCLKKTNYNSMHNVNVDIKTPSLI